MYDVGVGLSQKPRCRIAVRFLLARDNIGGLLVHPLFPHLESEMDKVIRVVLTCVGVVL